MSRIVMNSDAIERSIERLALEIIEQNQGVESVALVGIHTGGVFLASRLHEKMTRHEENEVPTASLDITLYRDDWSLISQNPIVHKTNIEFPVEEKNVVLVDDVIFTGRTIRAAMDAIMDYGRPRSIQLAVLVDRQGRELPIQPDYTGVCIRVDASERVDVLLTEDRKGDEVVIDSKEL